MPILLFVWLAGAAGFAAESLRPTHPDQLLIGTQADVGYRVKSARVVHFRRQALERLFPFLRGRRDADVRRWILDQCAYLNSRQLVLTGIRNTEVDHDPNDTKVFHISPGAGRGAEIEVEGGMINLKASGNSVWNADQTKLLVKTFDLGLEDLVRRVDHSTGLEVFYVATAEYLRHQLLAPAVEVVDALFLIDYGFDVIAPDENLRAYLIGREPHFGRVAEGYLYDQPYRDHGIFQSTYSGARIDLGGATLRTEGRLPLDQRAKWLGPRLMKSLIRWELAKPRLAFVPRDPTPTIDADLDQLHRSTADEHERWVDPRVLSSIPDAALGLRPWGDTPFVARIKAHLFGLSPEDLLATLARLDDQALCGLFNSSIGAVKIPLPEAAYHHGFARGTVVRACAARAALPVIERFGSLAEPVLREAYRGLEPSPDLIPGLVHDLLAHPLAFDGQADFLLAAFDAPNLRVRALARAVVRRRLAPLRWKYAVIEPGTNDCEALLMLLADQAGPNRQERTARHHDP